MAKQPKDIAASVRQRLPIVKSRYSFPSMSHIRVPRPRWIARGAGIV